MKNIKKVFSLVLAIMLLGTNFLTVSRASSQSEAIETIHEYGLEIVEVDEEFKKDAIIFDTVEEFKEFMDKFGSQEVKVEVKEHSLNTKLETITTSTKNTVKRTASVTYDLPFPMANVVVDSHFNYNYKDKTILRFLGGDVYPTGTTLVTTVSGAKVEGALSRGDLHIVATGSYDYKMVVEGIGTFYKAPFRASYVVKPSLSISSPQFKFL